MSSEDKGSNTGDLNEKPADSDKTKKSGLPQESSDNSFNTQKEQNDTQQAGKISDIWGWILTAGIFGGTAAGSMLLGKHKKSHTTDKGEDTEQ